MPYPVISESELAALKEKYAGKVIPLSAFSSGHTSQESGWLAVDGINVFFETDGEKHIRQQAASLLGAKLPGRRVIPFSADAF